MPRLPPEILFQILDTMIAMDFPLDVHPPNLLEPGKVRHLDSDSTCQNWADRGRLWRSGRRHRTRRFGNTCRSLRERFRRRTWEKVYVCDEYLWGELRILFQYLLFVDPTVLSLTRDFTLDFPGLSDSGVDPVAHLYELEFENDDSLNGLTIDSDGRLRPEDFVDFEWSVDDESQPFIFTRKDLWAYLRFFVERLVSVERVCWRSFLDLGYRNYGVSPIMILAKHNTVQRLEIEQSFPGGYFFASSLLPMTGLRELYINVWRGLSPAHDFQHEQAENEYVDPDWFTPRTRPSYSYLGRYLESATQLRSLTTSCFDDFDRPEVLAMLARIDVKVQNFPKVVGRGIKTPERDVELGQAAAAFRPALLEAAGQLKADKGTGSAAAPWTISADLVRAVAHRDERLERIRGAILQVAERAAVEFNRRLMEELVDEES